VSKAAWAFVVPHSIAEIIRAIEAQHDLTFFEVCVVKREEEVNKKWRRKNDENEILWEL
jgi:hypothetical protein